MAEALSHLRFQPQHNEHPEPVIRSLDIALEKYLNLLDRYQELQQKLAKNLSSGFLSLAQADFTSPNRIRYGQDFYDDRMQASVRVSIKDSRPQFNVDHSISEVTPKTNKKTPPLSTPEGASLGLKPTKVGVDPLNWFGILVPLALRTAQAAFKAAVLEETFELACLMREIGEAETEIRDLRNRIPYS